MSTQGGGKGYIKWECARIWYCRCGQNADKGEGVQNPENIVDVI